MAIASASYGGETGVVAFLLEIVTGASGGITRAEFDSDGPEGWDHKNPTLANRDHVKTKFRTAAEGGGGYHEWIPCSQLGPIVATATDEKTAMNAAEWIRVAHKARSPTWCVIFQPPSSPTSTATAYVDELLERMSAAEAAELVTVGGDFQLAGHSGALYMDADDGKGGTKRVQQVSGQGDFHKGLEAIVEPLLTGSPKKAKGPLLDYVDSSLWGGDINFVPGALHAHDDKIRSEYVGSAAVTWASLLQPFRIQAEEAKNQAKEQVKNAF